MNNPDDGALPDYEKRRRAERAAGSTQWLYNEQSRAWAARVIATFNERWMETRNGWVRRPR